VPEEFLDHRPCSLVETSEVLDRRLHGRFSPLADPCWDNSCSLARLTIDKIDSVERRGDSSSEGSSSKHVIVEMPSAFSTQ
jgi:hypothetical protein